MCYLCRPIVLSYWRYVRVKKKVMRYLIYFFVKYKK